MSRAAGMRRRLASDLRFAIPGDLETRTGGYIYDRRLIAELRRSGWSVEHLHWAPRFPFPDRGDEAAAARSLAACPDGSVVLIDGLAYGALPALAETEGDRLRLVALVHHPLADETGLTAAQVEQLARSERRALTMARAVIVTSETTGETLKRNYGLACERLTIARPGTDPASPARGSAHLPGGVPHLLSVGTVTPRKGHDLLVDALARIAHLPWICTIAGSTDLAPQTTADVRRRIAMHRLDARIRLIGEQADLSPLYDRADLFVLPSRYEGYGMAFAEALRHGLPVIGTTAGAIPEVVPSTAGLLVSPDDVTALASALRELIANPRARNALAAGARSVASALPSWQDTAARVASALLRAATTENRTSKAHPLP
jgi:glycosyltransferase involved in cell wall biosynthesis